MKKSRICFIIAAGLLIGALGAAQTAGAATGIVGSKHDLSSPNANNGASPLGSSPNVDEVCIFCHTPHGGASAVEGGPLWNRTLSTATYTPYTSSTLDSSPGQPTGVSKACLSCHDGTVGFNSLKNNRGPGFGTNSGASGAADMAALDALVPGGLAPYLGTDLSNDHPISMSYAAANSPSSASGTDDHATGFVAASGTPLVVPSPTGNLPLYTNGGFTDVVQCGTCHDPHRNPILDGVSGVQVGFLRKSNIGSQLCLTCHKKNVN